MGTGLTFPDDRYSLLWDSADAGGKAGYLHTWRVDVYTYVDVL
jgi:hypothetical protein